MKNRTTARICFVILILQLTISIIFASPIGETTILSDDVPTTEYYEVIFRVEESDVNHTVAGDPIAVDPTKLTPLPTDEVKDPVKEVIVVFRQEEGQGQVPAQEQAAEQGPEQPQTFEPEQGAGQGEPQTQEQEQQPGQPQTQEQEQQPGQSQLFEQEQQPGQPQPFEQEQQPGQPQPFEQEEEDESEEEEEPETDAGSSSPSSAVSASSTVVPEEDGPPPSASEPSTRPKTSTSHPLENVPTLGEHPPNPSELAPDESNLDNFQGLSPAVPSDLDETPDVPEVVAEEPQPPRRPAVPSVQPVQEGIIPVQEPGVFTRRPKPTIEVPSRPVPGFIDLEVTPGIPVEENPGVFVKETRPSAPARPPPQEVLPVLTPSNGKYKITKPKTPAPAAVTQKTVAPIDPSVNFSDEWNLTSSIFTLSPHGRAACECGKTPFKVDNADKSGINEYPWTVAVVRSGIFGGGRPYCGGVLINNAYILSSASCFESLYADNVQVWLTAHNNLQAIDNAIHSDRIIKRDVREILMHPNYDRKTHDNDIALVKLSYPVDISTSSYYVPACLPAGMSTYDGMAARVMGWATPVTANRYAPTTMCKEDIQVISNPVCNRDTTHRNKITGNQMCAGSLAKQQGESCISDAGGPLMLPNNGRFTLIGLVSFGFSNRQAYTPVVYTRVGTYADWILHNTEDAEWCSL